MNKSSNSDEKPRYDLEERTAKFAEEIIDFVRAIKQDAVNPVTTRSRKVVVSNEPC